MLWIAILFIVSLAAGKEKGCPPELDGPDWLLLATWCLPITGPPPRRPPEDILSELTQRHQIPVEYYYVDDSNKGQGAPTLALCLSEGD